MDCTDVENKVLFYVNDELSESEKKSFENHLCECENCKLLTQQFQNGFSLISKTKINDKDPYFYSRLKTRMEQKETFGWRFILKTKPILQFASYIVLGFFAITVGYLLANDTGTDYSINNDANELSNEELFANMNYLSMNSDDIYVLDADEIEE